MAHVAKHTRAAAGHLCSHYDRSEDNISNENIDRERTPENYNLGPHREVPQIEFIRQRTSEVQCMKRKDVNVMCSWIVTAPKDFPAADTRRFFDESYSFLTARYGGEKNVISSYVHMDEITPHMHFAFVPVVRDKRKDTEKVSAKECVTQKDLQTFHLDLERHMERVFGREIGLLNDATKDGNRTVAELKRESAAQIALEASQSAEKALARVNSLEGQERALKREMQDIKEKASEHRASLDKTIATVAAIEKIPVRPNKLNKDEVIISLNDWEKTKNRALQYSDPQLRTANKQLLEENNSLTQANDSYKASVPELQEKLRIAESARDHWVLQARAYESNYNRVWKEFSQIKAKDKNRNAPER